MSQREEDQEGMVPQDNKSFTLVHKNYQYSTEKVSKHIHMNYLRVVDAIKQKETKTVYCPTEKMIVENSNKPTHGDLFMR